MNTAKAEKMRLVKWGRQSGISVSGYDLDTVARPCFFPFGLVPRDFRDRHGLDGPKPVALADIIRKEQMHKKPASQAATRRHENVVKLLAAAEKREQEKERLLIIREQIELGLAALASVNVSVTVTMADAETIGYCVNGINDYCRIYRLNREGVSAEKLLRLYDHIADYRILRTIKQAVARTLGVEKEVVI